MLSVAALALSFAGCGEYTPPQNNGGDTPVVPDPDNPDKPKPGDDPEKEGAFTVTLNTLISEEAKESDTELSDAFWAGDLTKIRAQWTNVETNEVYSANFDATGVAYRTDLDGDYFVTIQNLPEEYTYKSSDVQHNVNNDDKELTIDLWPIRSIGQVGYYGADREPYYTLGNMGAYRITLGVGDKMFFNYKPPRQGEYVLETFADTVANEINPKAEVYAGNMPHYYNPRDKIAEQDGGGAENTYTKNIKLEFALGASYVGGSGIIFKIFSESINPNAKKLQIDFILERLKDHEDDVYNPARVMEVKEELKNIPRPEGTFTFASDYSGILNAENKGVLDSSKITLNPADGFYHYYEIVDGERVYGATVYAILGGNNYLHAGFGQSSGSSTLPAITPYLEQMKSLGRIQPSIREEARNYTSFVSKYVSFCNSDGAYPVTAELREFLDYFARDLKLFYDGAGHAESTTPRPIEDFNGNVTGSVPAPAMKSDHGSMWLYCCGLYR